MLPVETASGSRGKNLVIWVLLAICILGAASFKAIKIHRSEHFSAESPGSLFYSETAFHYRYAKLFAEEKDAVNIIHHDTAIEYPDTVDAFKYYTLMMEWSCGRAYRLFNFGLSGQLIQGRGFVLPFSRSSFPRTRPFR